jgi:hypothetical protein
LYYSEERVEKSRFVYAFCCLAANVHGPANAFRNDRPNFIFKKISFSIIKIPQLLKCELLRVEKQFHVDVRFFKQTETCLRSFWEFAKCLTAVIDKQLELYFLHYLLFCFIYFFVPPFLPSLPLPTYSASKQAGTSCQSADSYSEDGRFDPRPRQNFVAIFLGCRRRKPRHCLNEATATLPHAVIN